MLLDHDTGEMTNDVPMFDDMWAAPGASAGGGGGSSMPTGLVSDAQIDALNASVGGGAAASAGDVFAGMF